MQEKFSTVIVAAYTPEEYEKVLAISVDRDEMEKDWAQWRQVANELKAEIATPNVEYVEQLIDANGLLKYCQIENKPVDHEARADYAIWLYDQEKSKTTVTAEDSEDAEDAEPSKNVYTPPVDKLLTYTDIEDEDPLPKVNYIETFGLSSANIPELIQMATDDYLMREDASGFEFAAPLHAVTALQQLQAEAAIEPLLAYYDKASQNDNDWMLETLLDFFTVIGPVSLPALERFLADQSHDQSAQNFVTESVGKIAEKYPEAREECIAVLMRRLADFEVNHPELNATLIEALLGLKAVEAADVIEAAYASKRIDDFWGGSWEEAQYELGLKERPEEKERSIFLPSPSLLARPTIGTANPFIQKSTKKAPPTKKAKAKIAKASKKANRRKK